MGNRKKVTEPKRTVLLLTTKEYSRAIERFEEHKGEPTFDDFVVVVDDPFYEIEVPDENSAGLSNETIRTPWGRIPSKKRGE